MKTRPFLWALGIVCGLGLTVGLALAQEKTDKPAKDAKADKGKQGKTADVADNAEVVRFVSGADDVLVEHHYASSPYSSERYEVGVTRTPVYKVTIADCAGKSTAVMYTAANDARAKSVLKDMKPGDYLAVRAEKEGSRLFMRYLAPYTLKEGEDQPNVYVFTETTKKQVESRERLGVAVEKLNKDSVLWVPDVRGKDGKLAPDEQMAKRVATLSKGDSLEIVAAAGEITSVYKYMAPKTATFAELTTKKVGDADYDVVSLKESGSDVQLLIPKALIGGKMVSKPAILGPVRQYKKGMIITYKSYEEDGNTFIRELAFTGRYDKGEADPKTAAATK